MLIKDFIGNAVLTDMTFYDKDMLDLAKEINVSIDNGYVEIGPYLELYSNSYRIDTVFAMDADIKDDDFSEFLADETGEVTIHTHLPITDSEVYYECVDNIGDIDGIDLNKFVLRNYMRTTHGKAIKLMELLGYTPNGCWTQRSIETIDDDPHNTVERVCYKTIHEYFIKVNKTDDSDSESMNTALQ